jgi:hypothetical protein
MFRHDVFRRERVPVDSRPEATRAPGTRRETQVENERDGTVTTQVTAGSQPWRRTALSAFLIGIVGIALIGCASGEQKAEDQAVAEMTGQLTTLQDSAKYALRTSLDRGRAREDFARQQGGYVYASSIEGNAISWSIALVGQGGRSTSGSSTVIRLRSCLEMRSAAAFGLKLTAVTCPARFPSSPNFDSTDRDVDLLALGNYDEAPEATAPEAPSDRSPCLSGAPEGCVGG